MRQLKDRSSRLVFILLCVSLITFSGCLPADMLAMEVEAAPPSAQVQEQESISVTPLPTRPSYAPGELVDYIAQTGDTLPAIAAHFNTTVQEIRSANTFIPADATTMPPGMPMKIPIYYQALWGSPYQIIPDSLFINGPSQVGFETSEFVSSQPGWLRLYSDYVADRDRSGAEIVDYVATNYSVSPRLLLAVLEYQLGALSQSQMPSNLADYPLGFWDTSSRGLYRQLALAANLLNNAYYDWRTGDLKEIILSDGRFERPDPWQNSATVALHYYFSRYGSSEAYDRAISKDGLAKVFLDLYGDPWAFGPHITGSLRQPEMRLPFEPGKSWAFTGGPHNPWGDNAPLAALDFAPPSVVGGCTDTEEFTTAVADGVIVRTGTGTAVLDLDGDGDERTGWVVFYLHLAAKNMVSLGAQVKAGQPLGHPSCEGGRATGTHVHIARKYNGEWMPADGPLAFNLEGWISRKGPQAYLGYMLRQGRSISACVCSDQSSQMQADYR